MEAKRQGDVRHKDKYQDLPENIKEFDRVLARFILEIDRRIVEPLIEFRSNVLKYSGLIGWVALDNNEKEAINQIIKMQGEIL